MLPSAPKFGFYKILAFPFFFFVLPYIQSCKVRQPHRSFTLSKNKAHAYLKGITCISFGSVSFAVPLVWMIMP
jgi:hypothetical protein